MSSKPQFSQKSISDAMVVIPAWNESGSIGAVVKSIKQKYHIRVVVVDDGSIDKTGDIAKAAGAEVLSLVMNTGAWNAIQTGFRYAMTKGFNQVITMDADGQHFAESISTLIKHQKQTNADVVIGGNVGRAGTNRRISWSFFRMLTGFELQDFTSGLKIYNRNAIEVLLGRRAHLFDYQDLGTLLLLRRFGMEISEVPVPMQPRKNGHSRIFSTWWQVIEYMILSTILCMSKYCHYPKCLPEKKAATEISGEAK
jgi:hypothetical protein